jgi:hypothetical protein
MRAAGENVSSVAKGDSGPRRSMSIRQGDVAGRDV